MNSVVGNNSAFRCKQLTTQLNKTKIQQHGRNLRFFIYFFDVLRHRLAKNETNISRSRMDEACFFCHSASWAFVHQVVPTVRGLNTLRKCTFSVRMKNDKNCRLLLLFSVFLLLWLILRTHVVSVSLTYLISHSLFHSSFT